MRVAVSPRTQQIIPLQSWTTLKIVWWAQQKNLKKFLPCEQRLDTIVCFLNYIVLLSAPVKSLARWLLKTFVSLMCRIWRFMKIEGRCSPRQLQRTRQIHSSVNDPLVLGIHQSPLCPQHHGPATLHLPHYSRGTVHIQNSMNLYFHLSAAVQNHLISVLSHAMLAVCCVLGS